MFWAMIGFMVIFAAVFIIVAILSLGWALDRVGGKDTGFFNTLISAILMVILSVFIPCLGCIIALYLLKLRHRIGWIDAIVALVITAVLALIIFIVITFAFFGGIGALLALIPPFP